MFKRFAPVAAAVFILAGCAEMRGFIYGEVETDQQRAYRGAGIALGANALFDRHCLTELDTAVFTAAANMRATADAGGDMDKAGKKLKNELLLYAGRADVNFAADLGFSSAVDLSLGAMGKKVLKAGGKVAKQVIIARDRVNAIFDQKRDPTPAEWVQIDSEIVAARATLARRCE